MCSECGFEMFNIMSNTIEKLDLDIRNMYGIEQSLLEDLPILNCDCDSKSMLAADYFTPKSDSNPFFSLIICGICRKCGGYKKEQIRSVKIPFKLRSAPGHIGVNLTTFVKKDINNQLEYFN